MNYCYTESRWHERFIPALNRAAFESDRSSTIYDRELEFDREAENTLTLVVGSDSGLLYKYLLSSALPESSRIVLIEPDDVFEVVSAECQQWLDSQAFTADSPSVRLLSSTQWQTEVFDGGDNAWFLAGTVKLAQSHCAITDYVNLYYPLYRDIREAIANRHHQVHSQYSVKTFTHAQMLNCVDNHRPIYVDPDFGRDQVAVVLGGGPSLDQHLPWIMENRSRLFMIAVSRICTKLQELELYPDLVVAIDPYSVLYNVSKAGTQWKDVPLIHSHHVSPLLSQQWLGPRRHMGFRFPWDQFCPDLEPIIPSSGPTVGHAATVLASQLGFTTILLSGIDLCMNAQGNSHATGTPEAELLKLPGNFDAQVATYSGRQAGTSFDFYRSIEVMERIGQSVNQYADVLFNLSIHAAAVPSIPHIDCDAVLLGTGKPVFDTRNASDIDSTELAELRSRIAHDKKRLKLITGLCRKAGRLIDRLYGDAGRDPGPAYKRRLDTLEGRLEKTAPPLLKAIRLYMGHEFAQLRKPSGFSGMTESDMEQWARDYYSITRRGARFFIELLTEAERTITLREAELAPEPDIHWLLDQWRQNETPGRVVKFQESLLRTATPDEAAMVKNAVDAYRSSLTETASQHTERVLSAYGTIHKTMQSLRYLKNKLCIDDLQTYSGKLSGLEWPYDTISTYIQGILAELSDNPDDALACYQRVIDDCGDRLNSGKASVDSIGSLVEETLTNLTRLYLDRQDGESAINTLGTLCEISPQYIPSYANLLTMLGQHDAALELLTVYLDNYTHDWRAARQLAQVHAKAGHELLSRQAAHRAEEIRQTALGGARAA
ncbi:MAG: DUF115 domain-containing protein [Granulosicoccus sp.]|nr:DUF115 domain-containing protein [Granulosicoccus sp.]